MTDFQFRLGTLLRLRDRARDERRRQLAEAFNAQDALAAQADKVAGELHDLGQLHRQAMGIGTVNVDQVLSAQRYELVLRMEEKLLSQQTESLAEEIDRRRGALVEADREVKVLEKLRDRQHERFRQEKQRRETKDLDDVAGRGFWRERET